MCQRIAERQPQQGMCWPDGNVLPPPPAAELPGALPGPRQGVPKLRGPGAHASATGRPPRLPDLAGLHFLAFWADDGDRGHTGWSHTPKHDSLTEYPLSLHPSANSYASFNTQLELLYTALQTLQSLAPSDDQGISYSILCLPNRNGALPTCLT